MHTSSRLSEGLAGSETFLAQQGLIAGRKVSAPCGTHCPATSTFCATRYVHGNESFLSPQNHSGPRVAKLNKILQGNFSCLYGAIFLYGCRQKDVPRVKTFVGPCGSKVTMHPIVDYGHHRAPPRRRGTSPRSEARPSSASEAHPRGAAAANHGEAPGLVANHGEAPPPKMHAPWHPGSTLAPQGRKRAADGESEGRPLARASAPQACSHYRR